MKLSLSTKGFNSKPSSKEIRNMSFQTVDITVESLVNKLKQGYCFLNVYDFTTDSYQFLGKGIKKEHYVGSYSINIDLDHQHIPMKEMFDLSRIKPTFCYTTWSNSNLNTNEYSYRFIYVFDSIIQGVDSYKALYRYICSKNSLEYDIRASSPYQYMNGTSHDAEFIVCDKVYQIDDYSSILEVPKPIIIEQKQSSNINGFDTIELFNSTEFYTDYETMTYHQLYNKYKDMYRNQEQSVIPYTDGNDAMIELPEDWYEITRVFYKYKNEHGRCRKLHDGEGRRRALWVNLMIRRLISPDLTFEELLFSLIYEMLFYIDNDESSPYHENLVKDHKFNKITRQDLVNIAFYALHADLERFRESYKQIRKRMVNPEYQMIHGGTKRQIANKANADRCRQKKEMKYELIGEFYDFNLTINENVELMNEEEAFINRGIKVNKSLIYRWKRYLNNESN